MAVYIVNFLLVKLHAAAAADDDDNDNGKGVVG
jgi:hypothetical protein